MKEDQFDHIENRIREVIEHNHPDYEEASWDKMALLLAKEKKRRFPLWWFLLPLVTGFAVFVYVRTGENEQQATPQLSSTLMNPKASGKPIIHGPVTTARTTPVMPEEFPKEKGKAKLVMEDGPANPVIDSKKQTYVKSKSRFISRASVPASFENKPDQDITQDNKSVATQETAPIVSGDDQKEIAISADEQSKKIVAGEKQTLASSGQGSSGKKLDSNVIVQKVSQSKVVAGKPVKKHPRESGLYVLGTVGIDNSSVKFLSFKNSDPALQVGIGVGVDISPKLSVQTGVLASHKKYVAGPGDYNPKAGSYLSMVDIRKVDANCLVYEIPLSVKYNFYRGRKLNAFASAGISSYIMKREDYQYEYLRNNTVNYTSWEYKGNRHLFSVLDFSAGVEKKINDKFSLLASPIVSVPLRGVGDGKVKLYSSALQVSLKYKPAKKDKRHK